LRGTSEIQGYSRDGGFGNTLSVFPPRFSAGLEDAEDLIADLEQALQ
jgi:cystathionine beta-lyase/cystathionine gamma-synthase